MNFTDTFSNMMDGSNISLDSVQDFPCLDEKEVIVTEYWPDVPLSKIWIPRDLLLNRMKPSDNREARGIFHTLQKKGHSMCMESFATYFDSDSDNEEIFLSDNDNEVDASIKDCQVASQNSLIDILDKTREIPMTEFKRDFALENNFVCDTEKKKTNKNKKKKKEKKSVTLDKFLEDYTDERKQDDYCNDYLQKVLLEKTRGDTCQMRSTLEFPNLNDKKIEYCRSKDLETKDLTFQKAAELLAVPEVCDTNELSKISPAAEVNINTVHNIILENVPCGVSQDDISSLLCGYGEILTISLEPDGPEKEFLIAFVEISMDSDIDIDWVTECLNEAEPFGVSSKPLKCHKLP